MLNTDILERESWRVGQMENDSKGGNQKER